MNLPNKLTLVRCALTPIFLACVIIEFPFHYAVALLVFIVASLTDYFDGKIARKRNLVTNMGKFLDPLADKALRKKASRSAAACAQTSPGRPNSPVSR